MAKKQEFYLKLHRNKLRVRYIAPGVMVMHAILPRIFSQSQLRFPCYVFQNKFRYILLACIRIKFIFIEKGVVVKVNIQCIHNEEDIEVSLELTKFVADWPSAQSKFIANIINRFDGWLNIRSKDFRTINSDSLGDVQCICQLFAGACTIVFSPDFLRLNLTRITRKDYPTINEVILRSMDWYLTDFSNYGPIQISYMSNRHVSAASGISTDLYLSQFAHGKIVETLRSQSGIKYHPSSRLKLTDENNSWILYRLMEKSQLVEDGLFISTQIRLLSVQDMTVENQKELLEKLYELADQSTGIEYKDNQ